MGSTRFGMALGAAATVVALVVSIAPALASAAIGTTWQVQYSGNGAGPLLGVSCPTVTTCAVVGTSNSPGGPLVLTTTDGGGAWTQHLPSEISVGQPVVVACPTTTECLMSGLTNEGGTQNQIVITHDLWATWALETLPVAVNYMSGLACPTASVCWATGQVASKGEVVASYVFRTDNGGVTWRVRPIPPNATVLWGITCPSVSACWANGEAGNVPLILATTDRGADWSEQTLPSGLTYPIEGVSCATTADCMAVGATQSLGNATIVTNDGGAKWRMAASEPDYSGGLARVACVTNTGCQVLGDPYPGGTSLPEIFTTSTFGKSWSTFGPDIHGLSSVACAKPAYCWAVGSSSSNAGMILSTAPE